MDTEPLSYFDGAGVNPSRWWLGSSLGLGLGAFLASFLPLSLLAICSSVPQKGEVGKDKKCRMPAANRHFVDYGERFGYSEILARCSTGACVYSPGSSGRCVRMMSWRIGWNRLLAAGFSFRGVSFMRIRPARVLLKGELRQSSPEQICLAVGGNKARALDRRGQSAWRWIFVEICRTAGGFADRIFPRQAS